MTTATDIHPRSAPSAQPAPQGIEATVREVPAQPLEQARPGASPAGNAGHSPSRWSPERERPEDDEAVITAVLAAVTHRSFRERPEDDEVVITYTSELACPRVR